MRGPGEPITSPRRLQPGDVPSAASAIARAFAWHEPWGEWALPDPATRERTLLGLVSDDLRGRFLGHGECWTIGGLSVSLWIPPGPPVFRARRGEQEYASYGERAEAMRAGDELIASLKPDVEHWYLDTLATAPEHMRRGLGGRLLDHDLAIRDERAETCALDTHTRENVALYERRGFELIAEATLPGGGPDLYVMLREPR